MHGDKGWTYDLPKFKQTKTGAWILDRNKHVSATDYYAYRMHTRDPPGMQEIIEDTLTYGGMLKQQFDCDNWIKIEEQRLNWQKYNQKQLKADTYSGLADAVAANEHRQAGKYFVLSSSFQGSPRHNYKSYQDAMAMVRKHGKPDLFLADDSEWKECLSEAAMHLSPK